MSGTPVHLLRHTISVRRPSEVVTEGSVSLVYSTVLTDIAALVQGIHGEERVMDGAWRGRQRFTVFFDPAHVVMSEDLVVWDGKTLSVEGPPRDHGGMGVIASVVCVLVEE